MDIEKLRKNAGAKGFSFKYFATAREAADYMVGELTGRSVGIGGSKTVDTLDIYDRLCAECPDVAWHWKQEPDGARERAAHSEAYVTSANGIAETGEIVNIDGNGNRVASTLYGHKYLYIVAGVNKVEPTLERAVWRARNVAGPLRARSFDKNTPCVKGELRCYDCSSPERICRGMSILLAPMLSTEKTELVMVGEELGF